MKSGKTDLTEVHFLRNKRQKLFSLSLIFIVGLLIVGVASLLPNGFMRVTLTSIGSVVIGFGLTSVIAQVFSPAPFEGVLNMINELLSMPWRSKEEDLAPLRKQFFGYLYTIREGKGIWLYRNFDFGNLEVPGYLHACVQYPTRGKVSAKYKYYGFPVKSRLLLIGINANLKNEPAVIQVIPNCGQSGIYAGMAVLETISGENIFTPTILSSEPLVDIKDYGPIDDDISGPLNEIWEREFKSTLNLPPGTMKSH